MVSDMRATEAYKRLESDKLKEYEFDPREMLPSKVATNENIYKLENAGHYFISLDLSSAGFNALRFYDRDLVFGAKNWEELLGRYTKHMCLIKSKKYRAIVLSKVNPKAQQTIYQALMHRVYLKLIKSNVIQPDKVFSIFTSFCLPLLHTQAIDLCLFVVV